MADNARIVKRSRWRWGKDLTHKSLDPFMYIYTIVCLLMMLIAITESTSMSINIATLVFAPFWYGCFLSRSFRECTKAETLLKTVGQYLVLIVGFYMFGAMGFGFVNVVNGLTSPAQITVAKGTVVNKRRSSRYDARTLYLKTDQREVGIKVSPEIFDRVQVGDYYVSNYRLGGLGYYYRWRINSWNKWEGRVP